MNHSQATKFEITQLSVCPLKLDFLVKSNPSSEINNKSNTTSYTSIYFATEVAA